MGFSSLPVTSGPLTISCWFNRNSGPVFSGVSEVMVGFSTVGAPQQAYVLEITSGLNVRARQVGGVTPTTASATSLTTAPNGAWHFAAAVFAAVSSRRVHLDGNPPVSNNNPAFFGTATFGDVGSLAGSLGFQGSVGNVAVWDVALLTEQVDQLAAGFSPLQVASQNLVSFFPMNRNSTSESRVEGPSLTPVGSVTLVGGPPVYPTYV